MFENKLHVNKQCLASNMVTTIMLISWMVSPCIHSSVYEVNSKVTFLQPHPSAFYRNRGREDTGLLFQLLIAALRSYSMNITNPMGLASDSQISRSLIGLQHIHEPDKEKQGPCITVAQHRLQHHSTDCVWVCVCLCMCACVCVYVCVCMCMCVYVCVLSIIQISEHKRLTPI